MDVSKTWWRLASDITHYNGSPYLTVIDCGPSRFTLWQKMRDETAASVATELANIFCEIGVSAEFLSDNAPCYKSSRLRELMEKWGWGLEHIFSCAYRASGNGIVERNHRTIKRMMA